jgi:hypothetical protein
MAITMEILSLLRGNDAVHIHIGDSLTNVHLEQCIHFDDKPPLHEQRSTEISTEKCYKGQSFSSAFLPSILHSFLPFFGNKKIG